jgi:transketolase C-terminal domain/subunit
MKKELFDKLFEVMRKNKKVYLIFVGLGYPRLEEFKEKFGDRAINTEAAEQTAMDIAVGLAYSEKIPFIYTITPFLLRGFETIRTYINYENLNVKMIGAGVDDQYSRHDGFSHEACDIPNILYTLRNIIHFYPKTVNDMNNMIDRMVKDKRPSFINVSK